MKNSPEQQPSDTTSSPNSLQARRALIISLAFLGGLIPVTVATYINPLFVGWRQWFMYILPAFAGLGAVISAITSWRGRPEPGMKILITIFMILNLGVSFVVKDLGLLLGINSILIGAAIASLTLTERDTLRVLGISILVGVTVFVIDQIEIPGRLSLPGNIVQLSLLASVFLISFLGFLILRQMANYRFWRRLSIPAKLILSYSLLLLIGLGVTAVGLFGLNQVQNSYQQAIESTGSGIEGLARQIQTTLLEARRSEKDFLLNWKVEGFDTAYSNYVSLNQTQTERITELSADLFLLLQTDIDDVSAPQPLVEQIHDKYFLFQTPFESYKQDFSVLVSLIEQRGSEDTGLEGQFREAVNNIEDQIYNREGEENLVITMLQLRRWEKDYLLRSEQEYIDLVHELGAQLKNQIASSDQLAEAEKTLLTQLTDEYLVKFDELVSLDVQIAEKTTAVQAAEQAMEPLLEEIAQLGTQKTEADVILAQSETQQTTFGVIGGLIIVIFIGLGLAFVMTRQIANPITVLTAAAEQVRAGKMNVTTEIESEDEIGTLSTAFNEMTSQVRELIGTLEQRVAERTRDLEQERDQTQNLLVQLDEASRLAQLASFELYLDKQTVVFSDLYYELLHTTADHEGGHELPIMQAVQRFVYPDDAPRLQEALQSLGTTPMDEDLEIRLLDAYGVYRMFSILFNVESDERRSSSIVKGVVQDITERKQAEAALAKRASELQTVAEVSTVVTTIQDIETLLQQVVDLTKEHFHLYHAHVYLLDEATDTLVLRAGAGDAGRIMTAQSRSILLDHPSSLVARAGRTQAAVIVNDVSQAPDFLPNPLLPDTKSEMAIPLLIGERFLGVLDIQSDQLGYFTEDDQRIQTILADQVAVAISNAAQYTREQAQAKRLSDLVANTAGFSNPQIGMEAMMGLIVRNAIQLLETDDAGLWLATREDEIELKVNRNNDHLVGTTLKYGEGLSGRAIENGEVLHVEDYTAWSGRALSETRIRVAMAVPLIWQGKPIGVLALTREKAGEEFTEEDIRTAQLFASQAASAIENVRAYERTQQTLHELDILTRRLTRENWQEYLGEVERSRIGFIFEGDRLIPLGENGHSQQDEEKNIVQPVLLHGERIGQLIATDPEMEDAELQAILTAVSQGLSAHLENLRLTEEAERRVGELDMINDIGEALAAEVDLHKILQIVVDKLSRAFNANTAYAALYDANRQMVHIPYMLDHGNTILNEPPFPYGEGINSAIIRTRQSIFVNQDAEQHLRELGAMPAVTNASAAKSFLGVPLIAGENVIGVLSIQDAEREGRFTQSDLELLTTIAANVAVAIQNAQLFAQTQKRAERETLLNQIGQKIQSATTVQSALQTAIQELGIALKAKKTVVELKKQAVENQEVTPAGD